METENMSVKGKSPQQHQDVKMTTLAMNGTIKRLFNHQEIEFLDNLNMKCKNYPDYILFVENCRRKERKNLDTDMVSKVKDEINFIKDKHKKSKVLHIFQFKKGLTKTKKQIEITRKCQEIDNNDGICFYEEFSGQTIESFTKQIKDFLDFTENQDKYIVLEIESDDLVKKVTSAISKGFKNFIFTSGDYSNFDLWTTLTSTIRESGGKSFILLLARMHKTTKESYIKKAIEYGFDYVFHGVPFGGGDKSKDRIIRFLDESDLIYKEIDKLDEETKELFKKCLNKQQQYELSRVLAISKPELVKATKTSEVI